MRALFLALLVADAAFVLYSFEENKLTKYFTGWTEVGTIITFALNIYLHSGSVDRKPSQVVLKVHHFLFSMMAMSNVVTTFIYWMFLHHMMHTHKDFIDQPMRQAHSMFVHSFPCIFFYINWYYNDVVIQARLGLPIFVILLMYAGVNYKMTMNDGSNPYPFMDWIKDFNEALRNVFLLDIALVTVYVVIAKLSQRMKREFIESQKASEDSSGVK